jgi:hypothetical protein
MVDVLNLEDVSGIEEEKKEEVKEDKEEKSEEEPEIKLVEEHEEEPPPTEGELEVPFRRQEILKKYPNVFKDFPYLQTAYYRNQQFTELLSTPEEAQEVIEKAARLDNLEQTVLNGNIDDVLKTVKETDQAAFGKLIDNYLPTLFKVDQGAYYGVIGNVIKDTIGHMVNESRRLQNEDLQNAALLLNQFVFGTSEFQPRASFSRAENPQLSDAEQKLQQRERAFAEQRFNTVHGDLNTRVENILKSTIDQHIDPKESMSSYVRKNATNDAMNSVREVIEQDVTFRRHLDNLWKKAFASDFAKRDIDIIRSAYLSKAKTVLPEVIKKTRAEALRDAKGSSNEERTERKGPIPPGKARGSAPSSKSGGKDGKPNIPKGVSSFDYLMED